MNPTNEFYKRVKYTCDEKLLRSREKQYVVYNKLTIHCDDDKIHDIYATNHVNI
jgi:hypothetical protein